MKCMENMHGIVCHVKHTVQEKGHIRVKYMYENEHILVHIVFFKNIFRGLPYFCVFSCHAFVMCREG